MFPVVMARYRTIFRQVFFFLFGMTVFSVSAGGEGKENAVPPFSFLSTTLTGAHDFINTHPGSDGRGVIIFILDTGVDMGIPGLEKTSDGKVKVIDARDFTGQGDVILDSVRLVSRENEEFLELRGEKLYRVRDLPCQPRDGIYWMGWLDETRFMNSEVTDINENGIRTDKFGIVSFPVEEQGKSSWVSFIDLDNDRQLDDEKMLRNYCENFDSFRFGAEYGGGGKNSLTFVLHMYPEEKRLSLHFDDGSHGTHVAGIAAGYMINGEAGFNGIAPGAQIISCKIGNNTLSGGATVSGSMRRAYDFVIEYGKTHDVPVVVNMSYGIGSEIAGRSTMEKYLDEILAENERIVVCISAGNEGPGISTMGNPAGAHRVIASAGLLPPETGNNLLNTVSGENLIFFFSSRGGEIAKPDITSPAYAASTVPRFSPGEKYGGTSMASPQTAGAAALLLGALRIEQPDLNFNGMMVKRAIQNGAKELSGYSMLDQGAGLVNIPDAYDLLVEYAGRGLNDFRMLYAISTESPSFPEGSGETAYWRAGGFVPDRTSALNFKVKTVFPAGYSPSEIANFFKPYYLRSTQPWLIVNQAEGYLKEDHETIIPVLYDSGYFREPGLYTGKIVAYERKGEIGGAGRKDKIFELWNTVIIPYRFTADNGYSQKFTYKRIEAGRIDRYFIAVPPGASAMRALLKSAGGAECSVRPHLFDPEGKEKGEYDFTDAANGPVEITLSRDELIPGDWELAVYAGITNEKTSVYDLEILFSGIQSLPDAIHHFEYEKGGKPSAAISLVNLFPTLFTGTGSGEIEGYLSNSERIIGNRDRDLYQFTVTAEIRKIEFNIEFSKEIFNKFTDIAVNILDKEGKMVENEAFGFRTGTLIFDNPAQGDYTLQVIGGFAFPEDEADWSYSLTERYYRYEKITARLRANDDESITLYPGYPVACSVELDEAPRIVPAGSRCFGSVRILPDGVDSPALEIPIDVHLEF